jgi:S-phase kinase-associated protein 1
MAAVSPNTVRLKPSDGAEITVERKVAERSILIKNLLTDIPNEPSEEAIPIPNVSF